MQWRKTIQENHLQIDVLMVMVALLAVVSLFLERRLPFLFIGLLAIYFLFIRMYNKKMGEKLILANPTRFTRVFVGEELHFEIKIRNHSVMPYMKGYLYFDASHNVMNHNYFHLKYGEWNTYRIPISIVGKDEVSATVPLKAMSRGKMGIRNIRYTFSHPLTFETVELAFDGHYDTTAIIYPNAKSVQNITNTHDNYFGEETSPFSTYEDVLQPIRTRDYLPSDSFKRIHWKASAKRQTLQTKVFEHNQNLSWLLLINIAVKSPLGNDYVSKDAEKYLSEAAYIAKHIIKQGLPVEMFVNNYTTSGPLHVKVGKGIGHFRRILEALAIVDVNNIYPMNSIFHIVSNQHMQSQRIIYLGDSDNDNRESIEELKTLGHQVFYIEASTLLPFAAKGRERHEV